MKIDAKTATHPCTIDNSVMDELFCSFEARSYLGLEHANGTEVIPLTMEAMLDVVDKAEDMYRSKDVRLGSSDYTRALNSLEAIRVLYEYLIKVFRERIVARSNGREI